MKCTECNHEGPEEDFALDKRRSNLSGLAWCKTCARNYGKWNALNGGGGITNWADGHEKAWRSGLSPSEYINQRTIKMNRKFRIRIDFNFGSAISEVYSGEVETHEQAIALAEEIEVLFTKLQMTDYFISIEILYI